MSDIDNLLNNLDGEFRFDTGHVLLNLIQYSVRNKKYLELILQNQMEIRASMGKSSPLSSKESEQQFEDMLEEIQRETEKEYFDLLSFLTSGNRRDKE